MVLVRNPAINTITINTIKIRTGMLTEAMVVTGVRPTTHQVGKAATRALAEREVWVVVEAVMEAKTEFRG